MREFILFHRNGGWFTKSSQLHSDFRQAQVLPLDEAIDMCKLHDGKLMPIEKSMYEDIMKEVKV